MQEKRADGSDPRREERMVGAGRADDRRDWQAREGSVFLTTTAEPESDDGIALVLRDGIRLGAGVLVRYRKAGDTAALLVREAVE